MRYHEFGVKLKMGDVVFGNFQRGPMAIKTEQGRGVQPSHNVEAEQDLTGARTGVRRGAIAEPGMRPGSAAFQAASGVNTQVGRAGLHVELGRLAVTVEAVNRDFYELPAA